MTHTFKRIQCKADHFKFPRRTVVKACGKLLTILCSASTDAISRVYHALSQGGAHRKQMPQNSYLWASHLERCMTLNNHTIFQKNTQHLFFFDDYFQIERRRNLRGERERTTQNEILAFSRERLPPCTDYDATSYSLLPMQSEGHKLKIMRLVSSGHGNDANRHLQMKINTSTK